MFPTQGLQFCRTLRFFRRSLHAYLSLSPGSKHHIPRSHVNLIISGTILCLSFILTFTPALAGNTSSYRHTYNGSTIISSSLPSTAPQTDDPISTTEPTTPDIPSTTDADINSIPVANHDSFSTVQDSPVYIDILGNDSGLNNTPLTLSILTPPEHGQIIIGEDLSVTFIPDNGFTGADGLIYEIIDANGDRAIASASIEIQCGICPGDTLLTLSWNPNPDEVSGYAVYFGPTAESAIQLASELPLTSGLFDPLAPSIQYQLGKDLGLAQGDSLCFRLKAYNAAGFSDYSSAACIESVI